MNKSDLITSLATLPDGDARLEQIAGILSGKATTERPASLRLLRVCDFVKESNVSRSSVYRMIESGEIRTVQIRAGGSPRIPESELLRINEGCDK